MDNYDVKRFALVLALQADIDGMKALNSQNILNNNPSGYTDADFAYMAEKLRDLAYKHNDQL